MHVQDSSGIPGPGGHVLEVGRISASWEVLGVALERACREFVLEGFHEVRTNGPARCTVGYPEEETVKCLDIKVRIVLGVGLDIHVDRDIVTRSRDSNERAEEPLKPGPRRLGVESGIRARKGVVRRPRNSDSSSAMDGGPAGGERAWRDLVEILGENRGGRGCSREQAEAQRLRPGTLRGDTQR